MCTSLAKKYRLDGSSLIIHDSRLYTESKKGIQRQEQSKIGVIVESNNREWVIRES